MECESHTLVDARRLLQEASDAHVSLVQISINHKNHTEIFFHKPGSDSPIWQCGFANDHGSNLCAVIYQTMTSISDPRIDFSRNQTATIINKALPAEVSKIAVRTFPGVTGYDMILYMHYQHETEQTTHDDLATNLALQAIKKIDEDVFTVYTNLDVNRPETLQNFERFKNILMMAYLEGQKNPLPVPQ